MSLTSEQTTAYLGALRVERAHYEVHAPERLPAIDDEIARLTGAIPEASPGRPGRPAGKARRDAA